MSTASATRTIKFISKSGTYSAFIMSPCGDLFQEYESPAANTKVTPDFEVSGGSYYHPTLYFVLTSSRAAEGLVTPQMMTYHLGNVEMTFGSDGISTGVLAGVFKRVTPDASAGIDYHGLQILKNLAPLNNYTSCVIRMKALVSNGTQTDDIEARYPIPISRSTASGLRATIAAADLNNFVIKEKGGQCKLKVLLFEGATEVQGGFTVKWFRMGVSGTSAQWIDLGLTSTTITVNEADVQTSAQYRVEVTYGAATVYDIQTVLDASDPYDIEAGASPEDEAIYEDPSKNGQVVYTPKLVTRGGAVVSPQPLFSFNVYDSVGNDLGHTNTPASAYTVTRAMCVQGGGDVSLTIIAD